MSMHKFFLKVLFLYCFIQAAHAQTPLRFTVVDGKTNATVISKTADQTSQDRDGIKLQQSLSPENADYPQIWKVTITNTGQAQRWLYLRWTAAWNKTDKLEQLYYWNGRGEPVSGGALRDALPSNANGCTSMIQAIYDNQNGLALALSPFEVVSQFQQSLLSDGNKFQLQLQIPLVLDAGQSDSFPVEIYRFTPRYGYLDALQKYFSAHPDAFNARKDIDPAGAGVGAGYTAWSGFSFERTRRFGGDWDWVYSPFKRTGDIYGREQFWNYTPARPDTTWKGKITVEKFHTTRQSLLEKGAAAGTDMMFYVTSFMFCEINLAKEQYPGAIIYQPDGKYMWYTDYPNVTGYDNEVQVYPWGNKFAEQSMEDARDVVKENPISGFAYDVLSGGYPFRGAGMQESPRRAFDQNGEYVDLSVGISKMMNFTRNLECDGRKMALVGNASGNSRAFLVARCDSAMYESPPYKYVNRLLPLRLAMGHKILTWWDTYGLANILDWQNMSPAEIRAAYRGAADALCLLSYRYGGYPIPKLAEGVPSVMRILPQLKEVITQGWQAVPAVRAPQGDLPDYIWPARYGNGLGSYITIGNASPESWSGQVVIDNDYIGKTNYLFVDDKGRPLPQYLSGRTTLIDVQIPSHQTLVLRAVASVSLNVTGNATVSWNDDGAHGQLTFKSTFTPDQVIPLPADWDLSSHQGDNWNYVSRYFGSPLQDIINFPFFNETQTATIVLPTKFSPDEENATKLIQQYFQFWGKDGITPTRDIALKIVHDEPHATDTPTIFIGENNKKIQYINGALYINGNSPGTLTQATLKLLDALDQKYFYCGTFSDDNKDIVKKAGLTGAVLDE